MPPNRRDRPPWAGAVGLPFPPAVSPKSDHVRGPMAGYRFSTVEVEGETLSAGGSSGHHGVRVRSRQRAVQRGEIAVTGSHSTPTEQPAGAAKRCRSASDEVGSNIEALHRNAQGRTAGLS